MTRFTKITLLLLLVLPGLAMADQGSADSYGYMWTNSDGGVTINYNWVDLSGQTSIFGSSFNDSLSASIPLPFGFTFYGTVRNQVYISSNGWISFVSPGDTTYPINEVIPSGSGPDAALAVFWDDLESTPGNSGGVYYKTVGSSPNRQFVVEWRVINATGEIDFQVVLFEQSNLIKYQYRTVGASYNGGDNATIGIKSNSSLGNQYSYNQAASVASGDAILFHNASVASVQASISPASSEIGNFEIFNYKFYNIDPSGAAGLGKIDHVTITNPFSTTPSVISVKINNSSALLQYGTTKPTEMGRATWNYSGGILTVQTAIFNVSDSIVVQFGQTIPDVSTGDYTYTGAADANIDLSPLRNPSPQPVVNITSGGLDYIVIRDGPNQGGSIVTTRSLNTDQSLTLYAAGYDAADNYLGDQNATWSITGNLGGTGGSGTTFTFNPAVAPATGTIEADAGGGATDATGLISVSPGSLATMTIRTGPNETGIVAGALTMTTGDTQTFWAAGYDSDNNYRGDETATVWTSTLGISGSGASIEFSPVAPVTGTLTATVGPVFYTSGTITVNAGTLDYLIIRDAPNNGGTPVDNRTLTTDQSLTLYAAGYDASDNYIGDRNVTWAVTGTLGGTGSSGISFTFNPAVAPAYGTITASVSDKNDETGLITINVGALDSISIRTAENEGGIAVTTFNMTTDQSQTFWSAGYDADGNYRGDETATVWTSTLGIGGSGASILFDPPAPVSGTLTATVGGVFHTTGLITVTAGGISYLKIRNAPNGGGSEVTTLTMNADQAITMYAAAYDGNNNFIADQVVDWSVTGTLDGPPQNSLAYTFSPALAPASGSIVARLGSSQSTATGTITVNPGALATMQIRTAANNGGSLVTTLTMTTDQSQTFWAAGFDADGNYRGDEATTIWTSTLGISGSGPSILFDPSVPVTGTLTATSGTIFYTTGTITVTGGPLDRIVIRDSLNVPITDRALTADQQLKFFAAGFDAENNFLGNQTVNWAMTGSLDGPDQAGTNVYVFKPVLAPASGSVTASISGINAATGTISVSVGALDRVSINTTPDASGVPFTGGSLFANQSLTLYAVSYDADNNFRGIVSATWSSTPTLDPVSATGSTYTFTPLTAPSSGTIVITFSGKTDDSGTITVSGGTLHHIVIRDSAGGAGSAFTTAAITADDSLMLYAAGYDASDNYLGDVSVSWLSTGSLDAITANGPSFKFLPVKAPASGTIGAQADGKADFTETITVSLGALSQIRITDSNGVETGNVTLNAGESLDLFSRGYDSDGNLRGLVSATWGKTGTLDPVSATGASITFTPQTAPSSGKIYAAGGGFSDTTGVVTVISSGVLAKLRLRTQPGGLGNIYGDTLRTITADSSLTLWAAGYDASDNYLGDYTVDWYSIPTTVFDIINASGSSYTYNPVKTGKGKIAITNGTIGTTTGEITVNFGAMFELVINDGPDAGASKFVPTGPLQAGQSITLYAASYDQDGNWRGLVPATWSRTGSLDSVSATGTSLVFTPQTAPASGTINATYLTFSDITGTITVEASELAYIRIRNAPGGGGQIVADTAITADQTLALYAAGYDASGNYLNDFTVSWSSIGTIDQVVATAASYVFNPVKAPTSGTIRINSGDFNHQTGTITVNVGAPHHLAVTNVAGAAGIPVDTYTMTADQSLTLWAAEYDADSNFIANVAALWSQTGTLDISTVTATSFTFNPVTAPTSGTIRITYQTLPADETGTITVTPGPLFTVRINNSADAGGIAVGNVTLSVGETLTLYAAGYDQDGNWRGLENAAWQTGPTLDAQSGVGQSFTFTPVTAITSGQIMASVDGRSDVTGTITVTQGPLTSLKIRTGANNTGIEFTGRTMTADETLILYAAGYDAGGNYLQDEIVTWSNGSGTLNTVSASGDSLIFAPTLAPTSGTIKATAPGNIVAETGVITVLAGLAYQIVDYNDLDGKRTTVAGSTQWIRVRVTDQHGNPVPGTTVNFSPALRMSDPSDETDADGLAETVFTTLIDQDSASVTAAVTGLASFSFKVYGIRYVSPPGINPKIVPRGATQSFTITVSNPGDIAVPLSPASTNLSFSNGPYSYTAALQSPTTLPARNNSIVLTFGAVLINEAFPGGSYTPRIQLVGSGTFSSMNGSIYTTPGELTIGSDQITIGIITITGPSGNNEVLQGDKNITANMRVYNSGIPLSIDPFPATTVLFRMGGAIYPVDNLQRTDGLTTLPSNTESQLTFTFDLPANAQTGTVDVYGKLSLDNGNLPIEADEPTGTMFVRQSGNAQYVSGSLAPNVVVPGQTNVQLQATFANTGTANIVLSQSESTIEIVNSGIGTRTLLSQFILIGNDSTEVFFNNMNIPSGLTPGYYNVRWHLKGTLPNASIYDSTAVITNGIRVAAPANLRYDQIAIIPDTVRQGQSGIEIRYTIRNLGASSAVITSFDHNFTLVGDGAVPDNEWIPTDLNPVLPNTLPAGQSRIYTGTYALINNATTGVVQPAPVITYHDILIPGSNVELSNPSPAVNDQVTVIKPASIKISSLAALKARAPNAPFVNINQLFDMRVTVRNNGADHIQYTDVDIFKQPDLSTPVITLRLNDIAPGAQKYSDFEIFGTLKEQAIYTAVIDTAVDQIGNPVKPDQPDDRDEVITYQLPSSLTIDALIESVKGTSDSLVTSVDQIFTVRAKITNSGESAFIEDSLGSLILNVPGAYFELVNQQAGNIRTFTSDSSYVSWRLRTIEITPSGVYQPLTLRLHDRPFDKNTGKEVAGLVISDSIVHVQNKVKGEISSNQLTVTEPAGAVDSLLSTFQKFTVHAQIFYNTSMEDSVRTARIILPSSEWQLLSESDLVDLPAGLNVTAEWVVQAPERSLGPQPITVRATGIDKYSRQEVNKESPGLPLRVIDRADLRMFLDIVKEENIPGDTLSVGQTFDLSVRVTNSGLAGIKNTGRVYIQDMKEIEELSYAPGVPQQDTLEFSINQPVSWKLITNDLLASKTAGQENLSSLIGKLNEEVQAAQREGVYRKDRSLRSQALSSAISDLLIQSYDRETSLTIKMLEIPDDENTDKDAFTGDSVRTLPIYIQDKATIAISDPVVPDIVSTEQNFTFQISVRTKNNLQNAVGYLQLPPSFAEVNGNSVLTTTVSSDSDSTCLFNVKVPSVYGYQGAAQESLTVYVSGIDGNSNEVITSLPIEKIITLKIRPRVWMNYEILEPTSLRETGEVSHGQRMEVNVWAELVPNPRPADLQYADLSSNSRGTISLDTALFKSGFQNISGSAQSFDQIGQRKTFIMRAPNQNRTAQMKFSFSSLPRDMYSGTEIAVVADSSTLFIPVSVVEKEITVTLVDTLSDASTFTRGEGTHVLLAFNISNKTFQDPLFVNRLSVRFIARSDTTKLPDEGVLNLIEWIGVMNAEAAKAYLERPQAAETYVEMEVNEENVTNPMRISFGESIAQINGGESETIAVMVRYRNGTSSRSFRAVLTELNAYDSDPLYPVSIVDAKGVGIGDGTLSTEPIVITSGDPERTFGNFPNPFGRAPHETTEIRFLLLENSDVTLRIFSLAGELVRSQWNRSLANLEGSRSGSVYYITWDGANDNGDKVLNGVYLCVIQIKGASGKSSSFMTKIAYIK